MQERETLMVELTAIATNIEKACKVASRLPACYARLAEARKNAAPDVEALEEREREALALVHEYSAILDDTWEAVLRLSACYEGFVEDSRTTAQEVEAVSQVMSNAGRALPLDPDPSRDAVAEDSAGPGRVGGDPEERELSAGAVSTAQGPARPEEGHRGGRRFHADRCLGYWRKLSCRVTARRQRNRRPVPR